MACSAYPSGVSSIVSRPLVFLSLLLPLFLAACGPSEKDASWRGDAPKAPADPAADAGYLKAPALTASKSAANGVLLTGEAEPGSVVRLGSPTGEAVETRASATGAWTVTLEPSADVRLFGLSMSRDKRTVQSQGYLAILPDGRAAQLRSGATAFVYGGASDAPRLLTVDFDREGRASVAGMARAGGDLSLRIDRSLRGNGKADSQGRFHLAIPQPLNAGALTFEVTGDSGEESRVIQVSAAQDLTPPFRASRAGGAWRIDWITPGGGVQSTLILDPAS